MLLNGQLSISLGRLLFQRLNDATLFSRAGEGFVHRKRLVMSIRNLVIALAILLPFVAQAQLDVRYAYIERYKDIAIKEMDRAGIPASIKLAQGLLESGAGTSMLSQRANNHFGMKCGANWDGKRFYKEDDDFNEHGELIESCFRVFKSPEESFVAHSEFLRDPRKEYRYGFLFRLDPMDYKRWASGLKKSGYATSATYDQKLIRIIEQYELYKYDRVAGADPFVNVEETTYEDMLTGIFQVNDIDVILAKADDTPQRIANRIGIDIRKILDYNPQIKSQNQSLEKDERVYLEPKRNYYRGVKKSHYVREGETLLDISILYGVKVDKLERKNRIPAGANPATGERILLRGKLSRLEERPKLTNEVIPSDDPEVIDLDDFAWPPEEDVFGELELEPPVDDPEPIPTPTPDPPVIEDPIPDPPSVDPDPIPDPPVFPPVLIDPNGQPDPPQPVQPPVTPPDPPVVNDQNIHTVIKGDTLFSLSRRYNTTVDRIRELNGLPDNTIKIGQQLRIR
jgi:hypothetical protein